MSMKQGSQLNRLLGDKNTTTISVNGKTLVALIDSGSEVSTISKSLISDCELQSLNDTLILHGAGDNIVKYLGVIRT